MNGIFMKPLARKNIQVCKVYFELLEAFQNELETPWKN